MSEQNAEYNPDRDEVNDTSELHLPLDDDETDERKDTELLTDEEGKDKGWHAILDEFTRTKDTLLSTRREANKMAVQNEGPLLKESPNDPILISAASEGIPINYPFSKIVIRKPPHSFYTTRDPVISKRAEAARKFPFLTARYPEVGSSHSFTPGFHYVANFHRRACEERETRLNKTLNELCQVGSSKSTGFPLIGESFNERMAKHDRMKQSRLEAYIEDYIRPEEFSSLDFKPTENSLGRVIVKSRDKQIQEALLLRDSKELKRMDDYGVELNKQTLQLVSQQNNLVDFLNYSKYLRKPYWPY